LDGVYSKKNETQIEPTHFRDIGKVFSCNLPIPGQPRFNKINFSLILDMKLELHNRHSSSGVIYAPISWTTVPMPQHPEPNEMFCLPPCRPT